MKNTPVFSLYFTLFVALMLSSASALAHEQVDMSSVSALAVHIISAPDHVLMLVIAIAGLIWLAKRKFLRQRSSKIQHDK